MRAAEIYQYPLQTSAFEQSPLQAFRRSTQQRATEGTPPPVQVDTTVFSSSPIKDMNAQAWYDLRNRVKPLGQIPEPPSTQHTPAYTRGDYQMVSSPGLRIRVDLGVLLWQHTERGSPGNIGQILDTFV